MSYTMADYRREVVKEELGKMTTEERREILQTLTPEQQRNALKDLKESLQAKRPSRKGKSRRKR